MLGSIKHLKGTSESQMLALSKHTDDTLMKQLHTSASEKQTVEKKPHFTRRQEIVDEKIERLLIAYKKQDEIAHKKVTEMEKERKLGKKNLMEKFGFSDDEEEDVVVSAAEIKKKAMQLL